MGWLPPLLIAVPFAAGALLVTVGRLLPRLALDVVATCVAGAVTAGTLTLLWQATRTGHVVTWLGGWRPQGGFSVGIALVADPLGAGLAALCGVLTVCALVYSWRYFEVIESYFHALVLVFLAAMVGFCLTGDLFDMFVFLELMGVVAYALTAYKSEEPQSIQGAVNFAVSNTLGAAFTLTGIAFLYARTGELNLAATGRALAGHPADGLVMAGFLLICTGFLVKAAVVPFHFWCGDAHAVAPTPVCVLLSGVMDELGVYGVARVYWTAFRDTLPPHAVRVAFLTLGALTAVVGAIMCAAQHHVKRLLAFSTISHIGLFLVGVALLTPAGVAGAAIYVIGHALAKGALFLASGTLLARLGSVREVDLHGRGRDMPVTGGVFCVGGLALCGLPPFAGSLGKAVTESAAEDAHQLWITALFVLVSAVTGGAVLRVAARVFLGLGPRAGERKQPDEERAQELPHGRAPLTMSAPAVGMLALALAVGVLPGLAHQVGDAAAHLMARAAYAHAVLRVGVPGITPSADVHGHEPIGLGVGLTSALLGCLVALIPLARDRLPGGLDAIRRVAGPPVHVIRAAHTGRLGDYTAWLIFGLTLFAGLFGIGLR